MDVEREEQILRAGLKAAQGQISQHLQHREYPRDFSRLYEWLEDQVYALFEAIYHRKNNKIYRTAGEIIALTSKIAEFAYNEIQWEKLMPEDKEDEMADNQY